MRGMYCMDVAQPCALLLHSCDRYLLKGANEKVRGDMDGRLGLRRGHMLVSREISPWVTRGCWRAACGFGDLLGVFDLDHAAQESSPSVMSRAALVLYRNAIYLPSRSCSTHGFYLCNIAFL